MLTVSSAIVAILKAELENVRCKSAFEINALNCEMFFCLVKQLCHSKRLRSIVSIATATFLSTLPYHRCLLHSFTLVILFASLPLYRLYKCETGELQKDGKKSSILVGITPDQVATHPRLTCHQGIWVFIFMFTAANSGIFVSVIICRFVRALYFVIFCEEIFLVLLNWSV